jgi:small-conductance mechanosensitive channel
VFEPLQFDRFEGLLRTPAGWAELAVVVAAFVLGAVVDRHLARRRDESAEVLGVAGGVVRLAMPLVAFAVLIVASAVWRRYQPTLFLDVGLVLAVALAGIRVIVYTLRRLVPNASWLRSSERTVTWVVWLLVALHALGITPQIAAELEGIRIPLGKEEMTLLTIVRATVAVMLTIALTLWLSGLVEQRLMKTQLDLSQRALASKFVRAVLLVVGVLVALQAIGFDLTLLSVFGGALGVGIGLGLQKLASNYIAGFVILLDRSVRLGDLVTVDKQHGVVTGVTSRYVVVRSLDGIEAIVPNETLVTTTVLNHSFSTKDARVAVGITVGYDTDVDRALELMCEVARANPRVQLDGDRAPAAFVVRFGENGIDLELGVWIRDPESGNLKLRSDLNRAVWKAFRDAGIAVPFPQREVRILGTSGGPADDSSGRSLPPPSPPPG